MPHRTRYLFALAAALGCAGEPPAPRAGAALELPSPAGPGSGEPFLAVDDEGRVHMSWLEADGPAAHALRYDVLEGEEWRGARTVVTGEDFFVNWADFPSVVPLGGGRLAAHWLQRSGSGTYAYDVRLSHSEDGGATWSPSFVPHDDGTQTEHGFVTLFPDAEDSFGVVWLDGRDYARAAEGHGGDAEMTLRYARVAPRAGAGTARTLAVVEEALLDSRTCDCCQTDVALSAAGPVLVYRDRSPEEVRDMSVLRRGAAGWSEPAPLHRDGWTIDACPVNGPAAAAEGARVVSAWFTAAADTPRVRVAFSTDAGASFDAPLRVDDGAPEGRVDVVLLPDGAAAVAWLERTGGGAEVRVRRMGADGSRGDALVVGRTSAARASGFPRMVRAGERLVFAWTEPGEPAHVRVAALPLEAL